MIDVGIGIPSMFPNVERALLIDWCRRADSAGFSSLSTGERIAFGNHDLLVTMSMAAAVTEQVRLMTTVLAAPLHRTGLLAKQAASIDVLSEGRLVLGLGISERPQDFEAVGVPYSGRADRFEAQLHELRQIWSEPGDTCPAPYTPGGPPILIGAFAPRALQRAGRLADGLASFHFSPDPVFQKEPYDHVLSAWKDAGRPGRPRWAAGTYFSLGPDGPARAAQWIRTYYGYLPLETQNWMIEAVRTTSADGIRRCIEDFAEAGADEVYFSPMIPEIDQVERLAALLG